MEKALDYIALGNRIKQVRERNGLTQEKLGEACSISASHIGHIERGTRIPSIDSLYKISCALNVSMDFLIFDSTEDVDNLLKNISSILKNKDKAKVKYFITTVKVLAENIDEL